MVRTTDVTMAMVLAAALGCGLAKGDATVAPTGSAAAAPAAAPTFTITDAQADLAAGKYPDCLQKIAKLLSTAAAAPSADRAALLLLKGECLLQQKQGSGAADAFSAAGSAYPPKDSKDGKDPKNKNGKYWVQIATAEATSELIKKSPELQYKPTTGKDTTTPLPIVDAKARPAALTALFNDELAADQTAIKPLTQGSPSLPAIVEFAPKLHDLDNLEVASTGTDAQTATMLTSLATAAKTGIDTAITQITTRESTISASAATKVQIPGTGGTKKKPAQPQEKPKGLTEGERTNLQNDLGTLNQLPPWFKTLISSLNLDADYFKQETANAKSLTTKIQALLSKYSG